MGRVEATIALLVGTPLVFVGLAIAGDLTVSAAVPVLIGPNATPYEAPVLKWLKTGGPMPLQLMVLLAAAVLAGVWDVLDLNGMVGNYRGGSNNILPKNHPLGFVLLRVRRYVLVPVVAATWFIVYAYLAGQYQPADRSHMVAAIIAFLFARRPLNSSHFQAIADACRLMEAGCNGVAGRNA
jgi:hypothetical protein